MAEQSKYNYSWLTKKEKNIGLSKYAVTIFETLNPESTIINKKSLIIFKFELQYYSTRYKATGIPARGRELVLLSSGKSTPLRGFVGRCHSSGHDRSRSPQQRCLCPVLECSTNVEASSVSRLG